MEATGGRINVLLWVTAAVAIPRPLDAQRTAPAHWRWALDQPAQHVNQSDVVPAGTFGFVTMAPGWHATMGPGGVLYDPRLLADGRFTVESRLVLFPGTAAAEYGVFVGGKGLDAPAAQWVAFVVRRDGSAAVLKRDGGRTEALLPWTARAGVKAHPGGNTTVANTVRVAVDTAVVFLVNDSTVATFPRERLDLNGNFGLRIGEGLNLHITTLDVALRLAPVPQAERPGSR